MRYLNTNNIFRSVFISLLIMFLQACNSGSDIVSDTSKAERPLYCEQLPNGCLIIPTINPNRLAKTDVVSCSDPADFRREGDAITCAALTDADRETGTVALSVDLSFVNGDKHNHADGLISYQLPSDGTELKGYLTFARAGRPISDSASQFWVFAFLDDRNVTEELFGDENMVVLNSSLELHYSDFTIPTNAVAEGKVLSLLLIDRFLAVDFPSSRQFSFTRAVIGNPSSIFSGVTKIESNEGIRTSDYDTLVETVFDDTGSSSAKIRISRGPNPEIPGMWQQTSLFPVDPIEGRRQVMSCGNDSEGWVVFKIVEEYTEIPCEFRDAADAKATVAVVINDQFAIDPNTGNEFVSVLLTKGLSFLEF